MYVNQQNIAHKLLRSSESSTNGDLNMHNLCMPGVEIKG